MKKLLTAVVLMTLVVVLLLSTLACSQTSSFEATAVKVEFYMKDRRFGLDRVYVQATFDNGLTVERDAEYYLGAVKKRHADEIMVGKRYIVSFDGDYYLLSAIEVKNR